VNGGHKQEKEGRTIEAVEGSDEERGPPLVVRLVYVRGGRLDDPINKSFASILSGEIQRCPSGEMSTGHKTVSTRTRTTSTLLMRRRP